MQRAFLFISIAAALALPTSAETSLQGAVFRALTDALRIKVVSDDELEFTPEREGPNLVCKYSHDGDFLRVVATVSGSTQAIYFRFIPEGLRSPDGTILYDVAHFEPAFKAAAAEQERRLDAAVAAAVARAASATPTPTRPIPVSAPRPEYPYEARSRHITGAGVAVITVSPHSGAVTDVTMAQSTGSPMLDNAIVSAFRRWRFQPGSYDPHVRIPISFTMAGATY
jgi:TonB family protein